jgi:hypothetical protein
LSYANLGIFPWFFLKVLSTKSPILKKSGFFISHVSYYW